MAEAIELPRPGRIQYYLVEGVTFGGRDFEAIHGAARCIPGEPTRSQVDPGPWESESAFMERPNAGELLRAWETGDDGPYERVMEFIRREREVDELLPEVGDVDVVEFVAGLQLNDPEMEQLYRDHVTDVLRNSAPVRSSPLRSV